MRSHDSIQRWSRNSSPSRTAISIACAHWSRPSPRIVNATWDWGGGDWETGLGAAAHVGRRDIALFLLDSGARLDVFAAAMLGYLDVVQAAVAARPDVVHVAGPHGIPLIAHAKAGGEGAAAVLAFLEERLRRSA